jgi:hypothetical protein
MKQTISAADAAPLTTPVTVRAGSPAALLAIVPHLLGFVPEASLVVIGTAPPRDRVKVTLRYDLPDPPDTALASDIAAHAAGVIGSQQMTTAVAVGYGHEPLVTHWRILPLNTHYSPLAACRLVRRYCMGLGLDPDARPRRRQCRQPAVPGEPDR